MRRTLVVGLVLLTLTACGEGGLTMSEYAARLEALAADLAVRLGALDARMESGTADIEDARQVLGEAVVIRRAFDRDLRALDPPGQIADLHAVLVETHGTILSAQEAWATVARSATDLAELEETEETQVYRAAVAASLSLCNEFQATFDATADRETLTDAPWLPGDMKEIVEVTFGC